MNYKSDFNDAYIMMVMQTFLNKEPCFNKLYKLTSTNLRYHLILCSNINVFRCCIFRYYDIRQDYFTTYHFWFINWFFIWISKLFLIMVLNYFPTSWISWFWYSLVLSIIHTQSRIVHLWRWPQTSFWTCARKPLKKKSWLRSISYDVVLKHSLVFLKLW